MNAIGGVYRKRLAKPDNAGPKKRLTLRAVRQIGACDRFQRDLDGRDVMICWYFECCSNGICEVGSGITALRASTADIEE